MCGSKRLHSIFFLLCLTVASFIRADETFSFAHPAAKETSTKRWNGEQGWLNGANESCYERLRGVGLRAKAASAMTLARVEPLTVAIVKVTVVASGKTAAEAKSHILKLTLQDSEGVELGCEAAFDFGGVVGVAKELVFRLEAPVSVLKVTLQNIKDANVFEVNAVTLVTEFPPLAVAWEMPREVSMGTTFLCAVTLSGGSGDYRQLGWTFNGNTQTQFADDFSFGTVEFVAPTETGKATLMLIVVDSTGRTERFSTEMTVRPFIAPSNLQLSNLTPTGFSVTWQCDERVAPETCTASVVWQADEQVIIPLESDAVPLLLDLKPWTQGRAGLLSLTSKTQETVEYRWGEGEWNVWGTIAIPGMETFLDLQLPPQDLRLSLRFPSGTVPAIQLRLQLKAPQQEGQVSDSFRRATFENLPAGQTLWLTVTANYRRDDGSLQRSTSNSLKVELPEIPPFKKAGEAQESSPSYFQQALTFPVGYRQGRAQIFARVPVVQKLPPGVWLTRVLFTESNARTGMVSYKALALTNTSNETVSLAPYTLQSVKDGSETVMQWKLEPYTLPPHGELLLAYEKNGMPSLPLLDTTVQVVRKSILNFTPQRTLTLLKSEVPVNTLRPAKNAVVRLCYDTIEQTEAVPIQAEGERLPTFYASWVQPPEERFLQSLIIEPHSTSDDTAWVNWYEDRDRWAAQNYERVWMACRVCDGGAESRPIEIELYRSTPLLEGYLLRVR
ncbi:MAG: hypothetical protein RR417_03535 [Kiritimatiellia bacterium]